MNAATHFIGNMDCEGKLGKIANIGNMDCEGILQRELSYLSYMYVANHGNLFSAMYLLREFAEPHTRTNSVHNEGGNDECSDALHWEHK